MNRHIFEGNWNELKGNLKTMWGKLTEDDLKVLEGNQEEIYGQLQKYYGYNKEQAEREIKNFNHKYH